MKRERQKSYEPPKVQVSYPKARLAELARPHGGIVTYVRIDGNPV